MKILKNKMVLKYLIISFIIIVCFCVFCIIDINLFKISGNWYCDDGNTIIKYIFNKSGFFKTIDLYYDRIESGKYTIDRKNGRFAFKFNKQYSDRVEIETVEYKIKEYKRERLILCEKDDENDCLAFYRNKKDAKPYDSSCLEPNVGDFCIEDDKLLAYTGTKKTVEIPSNIRVIGSNAFAGDFGRGVNLKKITIPGNVKIINSSAFMFSNIDEIYMEEGVEYIENYAFAETCVSVLDFPKSIKKIGRGDIVGSEEKCNITLKIYLYADSVADKYFETRTPYYDDYELIYKDE